MSECQFNEEEKAYEIYIDETENKQITNITGYSVFCKKDSANKAEHYLLIFILNSKVYYDFQVIF